MRLSMKTSLQNSDSSVATHEPRQSLLQERVSRKYRVLLVASHPVQYASPLFRLLAQDSRLDVQVAYCSLQGAEPGKDPEFGMEIAWDVPLLDGYSWQQIPNRSPRPGLGRFLGLINTGLWKLVRSGNFDAVIVYGYAYLSYWIVFLAAKTSGIPILLPTDSVRLQNYRGGWWWKRWLKRPAIQFIYKQMANAIMAPSTATQRFLKSIGIPADRIYLTNYVVDNDSFQKAAEQIDPVIVRRNWNIPAGAFVVLFCAKLVPWKRPEDVLSAFAAICRGKSKGSDSAFLVFAGDGPLRTDLERRVKELGLGERIRFLGFVNQTKLPEVYAASDMLVLPSEYEAWGLVVNEAMVCGIPAVVSDRVGANLDLITPGVTGDVFPMGNVEALAEILLRYMSYPERTRAMGQSARSRMENWSYREHFAGIVGAIERVASRK